MQTDPYVRLVFVLASKMRLSENIIDATDELGISTAVDQAAGSPIGGYFCPHNIDPAKTTRSSAREAYYNPAQNRTNLNLITGQQVTRLIVESTNGTAVVTGVEVSACPGFLALKLYPYSACVWTKELTPAQFAASADAERSTVGVTREAIMAAGSLHTPQILQVSGIGASSLLESIGVSTVVDLPAVGENFQDHSLLSTVATGMF